MMQGQSAASGTTTGAASGAAAVPRYALDGVRYRPAAEALTQIAEGNWLDLSIGDTLRHAAAERPDAAAVIDRDGATTYAQLDADSESVAAALLDLGLRPGYRVLFQLGTTRDYFTAFYACMKAGVVPVCTLPQYRTVEMEHFAAKTAARAIFVQADCNPSFDQVGFAQALAATCATLDHVVVVRGEREGCVSLAAAARAYPLAQARARTAAVAPSASDVAVFQLSGGSTSLPKIIPRMHGEYLGAVRHLSQRYGLTDADVTLWGLPLVHNAGTMFAVLPVTLDRRTLVLQSRLDVREMLELIGRHRVTFTGSVGPVAAKLLEVSDLHRHDIGSLRQFFALASAEAVERHVGLPVGQMFGMTEGMVFAASPQDCAAIRHRTIGYPISPGDEVRLLVPGEETEVAFGEVGELCFRGPSTLTGYVGDEEATAASFTSTGFLRSGDLMRAHVIEGVTCYSFEGRIKDNINRGGEKIGAEEIETLAARHPDIADIRVVAMPDRIYGEKVCAYVIPQVGSDCPTVASLGAFLLGLGIAKYKLPERVERIDAFPLTRVGKADKAALRELVAAAIAAETRQDA
ncbi:AMP-binding protein [uncultured Sphingomonas sp.]|uniref:AMP-binding protein n=1 Tax=uncultured Sphingomonas sp. TaxID=158754 RepID=UPI0035CB0E30